MCHRPPVSCGQTGMPFGGGTGFMGPPPCPMNVMPMLPAYPPPRTYAPPPPPPCASAEHNAKIIADVGATFLEDLTQLKECKQLTAEVNGKTYSLKLGCTKDKKKKKRSSSSGSRSGCSEGINFKCCDCNVPVPPGICKPDSGADSKAIVKEEKMHKCLSLCLQMMREMFRRKYEEQEAENENAIQMVEIPVMIMPQGGMGGMSGIEMMGGIGMGGMPMGGMGMGGMPMSGMGMGGMPMGGMGMGGIPMGGMGMGGMQMGGAYGPEKAGPSGTYSSKAEKPKVVCKTNRDQQCDESSLAKAKGDEEKGKDKDKDKDKDKGKDKKKGKKK